MWPQRLRQGGLSAEVGKLLSLSPFHKLVSSKSAAVEKKERFAVLIPHEKP